MQRVEKVSTGRNFLIIVLFSTPANHDLVIWFWQELYKSMDWQWNYFWQMISLPGHIIEKWKSIWQKNCLYLRKNLLKRLIMLYSSKMAKFWKSNHLKLINSTYEFYLKVWSKYVSKKRIPSLDECSAYEATRFLYSN